MTHPIINQELVSLSPKHISIDDCIATAKITDLGGLRKDLGRFKRLARTEKLSSGPCQPEHQPHHEATAQNMSS